MKTLIILSVLLATISTRTLAESNEKEKTEAHKLDMVYETPQKLSNHIFYPEQAKAMQLEGSVRVEFYVDSLGNITINAINGHPLLMESVKEQLQKMCVDPKKCQGKKLICFKFEIR